MTSAKTETPERDVTRKGVPRRSPTHERLHAWPGHVGRFLREEQLILSVLVLTFLARFFVADRNSYWLDELLSVNVYALWHDSAGDALAYLADASVHPPLYQLTLYHWVGAFGDAEIATRTLSNLYVTLAALFLYLLVRDAWSRRVALLSAVTFSLMYTPTYYALETRSYAQTIFLVALSSYLLLRLLHGPRDVSLWRSPAVVAPAALLIAANAALLLTHYYNVFFIAAQALIAGLYLLREWPRRRWPAAAAGLSVVYAVPPVLFWVWWGDKFVRQLDERSGQYEVAATGPGHTLGELLLDFVVRVNIDPPRIIAWAGVAAAALLLLRSVVVVARAGAPGRQRRLAWTVIYLAAWLALPLLIAYVAFAMVGVERYHDRYFVFSVVPLAALVVLTVEEGARLAGRAFRRLPTAAVGSILASAAIVTLVLPGAHQAATEAEYDWRGIVRQVVDVVETDEGHDYIIYETAFRTRPMTDYYFERFSDEVRPHATLRRFEELRGRYRILTEDEPVVAAHDYLIVVFPHLGVSGFPNALEALEARYEVRHRQLNDLGNGFIVFDVHPD